MGGITGGYKILIPLTQVKQGKVHRILITPLQSHSKLHWKIPVFSLQCSHRNGWNHRGVKMFNPSTQFYYPLGSVRMAERLALPTLDHGVAGSNPAEGKILPEPKRRFIAQSLSCSLFHCLEMTEILLKGRKTLTHPSVITHWDGREIEKTLELYCRLTECSQYDVNSFDWALTPQLKPTILPYRNLVWTCTTLSWRHSRRPSSQKPGGISSTNSVQVINPCIPL